MRTEICLQNPVSFQKKNCLSLEIYAYYECISIGRRMSAILLCDCELLKPFVNAWNFTLFGPLFGESLATMATCEHFYEVSEKLKIFCHTNKDLWQFFGNCLFSFSVGSMGFRTQEGFKKQKRIKEWHKGLRRQHGSIRKNIT